MTKPAIDDEEVLKHDLGISNAPPNSPKGPPRPADADFQIYIPESETGEDAANQHLTVLALRNGDLLATWTTGRLEGSASQRVVISRSRDDGKTWSSPECFASAADDGFIASWSFPFVVSETGRIYMFYHKHRGKVDYHHQWTSQLWYQVSDDDGLTWSRPYTHLRIERNGFSHPDPEMDTNFIIYQPPIITARGTVLVGMTHVGTKSLALDGVTPPSEVRFLRFDNILTATDPGDLKMTTLPRGGGDGLRFEGPDPYACFLQEPSLVNLSDGRIFCAMRSMVGYVVWSQSSDDGESWSIPEILRYHDGGEGIRHPVVPCPIFPLGDGRFVLIHHNNSGDANSGRSPIDWCRNRRPVYLSVARESLASHQPLAFSEPRLLADNDRVPISPKQLTEIGTYPSLVQIKGEPWFCFPDRKHYLLGKRLGPELLENGGTGA